MALNRRQTRFFTDTVDIYAMSDFSLTSKRVTTGPAYPATPTYSGVLCHLTPSIEATYPGPIGRQDYDIVQTMDQLRLPISQPIGAGWYVQLKTSGHPEEGSWYVVQGDPRNHTWRADERVVFMKKGTKPPGVA